MCYSLASTEVDTGAQGSQSQMVETSAHWNEDDDEHVIVKVHRRMSSYTSISWPRSQDQDQAEDGVLCCGVFTFASRQIQSNEQADDVPATVRQAYRRCESVKCGKGKDRGK
jgi:hypothetical protein